jgi:hypothetical protein
MKRRQLIAEKDPDHLRQKAYSMPIDRRPGDQEISFNIDWLKNGSGRQVR